MCITQFSEDTNCLIWMRVTSILTFPSGLHCLGRELILKCMYIDMRACVIKSLKHDYLMSSLE